MESTHQRAGSRGKPRAGFVIEGYFVGSVAARLHRLLEADTDARTISNAQIAARLGTSRRMIQYALRELESVGLVETAYSRLGRLVEPMSSGRGISPLADTNRPVRPRRRVKGTL